MTFEERVIAAQVAVTEAGWITEVMGALEALVAERAKAQREDTGNRPNTPEPREMPPHSFRAVSADEVSAYLTRRLECLTGQSLPRAPQSYSHWGMHA